MEHKTRKPFFGDLMMFLLTVGGWFTGLYLSADSSPLVQTMSSVSGALIGLAVYQIVIRIVFIFTVYKHFL